MFGGEAGVAYDVNYHKIGDTIDNLAHDAFVLNTKSIANSVAKYAMSFDTIPQVELAKRGWNDNNDAKVKAMLAKRQAGGHFHAHSGPCGGGTAQ